VITVQTAQTTYVSLNRTLVQYSHGALAAVLCFALYILSVIFATVIGLKTFAVETVWTGAV